jgi:UDPglucose 6-dehydrogenase
VDISIFGTGYVGLVTGACFAESGNRVCCVDIDADKVAALQRGDIPIYEPGLAEMVEQNARDGRLIFTTDAEKGIDHGRVIFIAVNTPSSDDGASDLSSVRAVARTIGNLLSHPAVIVNKSTVPVGTADVVREIIADALAERGVDVTFDVVSNPEFLKEGDAISDFMRPDRIVLGAERSESIEIMRHLYGPFNRNHNRIIVMDIRSSELTKYAANALLATKISFMNEIANIAERVGANVENIRAGIGSDARIGYHFIYAGIGYGGSCFPKDIRALSHTALEAGYEAELINAVESVNERQKQVLLEKILEHFDGSIRDKTFAIWGIAFKPKTDDIREAPSRALIEALWEHGARAQVYDPEAMDNLEALYGERPDLILAGSRDDTVLGADALVICTEWRQFRSPDFAFLREHLQQPVIFDGRNMYDPERIRREGFTYYGVGLGETSTRTALPDTIAEDSLLSVLAND